MDALRIGVPAILAKGLKQLVSGGTGEVRASGREKTCSVAVPARVVKLPGACKEQVWRPEFTVLEFVN